jgi:hypothetical protein
LLTCSLLARRLTGYLPSFRSLFLPHLVTYVLTDLLAGFCKKPSLLWTNSQELIEACRGGFHRRAPPRSRPAHSSPTQGELRPSSGRAQAELRPSSGRAQAELKQNCLARRSASQLTAATPPALRAGVSGGASSCLVPHRANSTGDTCSRGAACAQVSGK